MALASVSAHWRDSRCIQGRKVEISTGMTVTNAGIGKEQVGQVGVKGSLAKFGLQSAGQTPEKARHSP